MLSVLLVVANVIVFLFSIFLVFVAQEISSSSKSVTAHMINAVFHFVYSFLTLSIVILCVLMGFILVILLRHVVSVWPSTKRGRRGHIVSKGLLHATSSNTSQSSHATSSNNSQSSTSPSHLPTISDSLNNLIAFALKSQFLSNQTLVIDALIQLLNQSLSEMPEWLGDLELFKFKFGQNDIPQILRLDIQPYNAESSQKHTIESSSKQHTVQSSSKKHTFESQSKKHTVQSSSSTQSDSTFNSYINFTTPFASEHTNGLQIDTDITYESRDFEIDFGTSIWIDVPTSGFASLPLRVQLSNLCLEASLRIRIDETFNSVYITFLKPPKYDIEFGSKIGTSLENLPHVTRIINRVIDLIVDKLTAPYEFVVDIPPNVQNIFKENLIIYLINQNLLNQPSSNQNLLNQPSSTPTTPTKTSTDSSFTHQKKKTPKLGSSPTTHSNKSTPTKNKLRKRKKSKIQ